MILLSAERKKFAPRIACREGKRVRKKRQGNSFGEGKDVRDFPRKRIKRTFWLARKEPIVIGGKGGGGGWWGGGGVIPARKRRREYIYEWGEGLAYYEDKK